MKNVLLTTTALVAFAGAATAADVSLSYSGDAFAQYNFDTSDFEGGLNIEVDMAVTQELNNGAVFTLDVPVAWDLDASDIDDASDFNTSNVDWTATLEASYGSVSFGPGVSNVNNGVFSEVAGMDVDTDGTDTDDTSGSIDFGSAAHSLRAETTLGGYALAASTNETGSDVAVNASGTAGAIDFAVFYETTAFGLNVSGDFSGVSFAAAYADDGVNTSMGVGLGYDITSTISVSGSYAQNTIGADQIAVGVAYDDGAISGSADYDVDASVLDLAAGYTTEIQAGTTVTVGVTVDDATGAAIVGYNIDVAYVDGDLGVYAGFDDVDGTYVGANWNLGGGANAYVYMTDYDEAGPLEWSGAETVAGLSIEF